MKEFDMKLTQKYIKIYNKASKKKKSRIIDEYCSLTGVKRNTAIQRINRYSTNYRKVKKHRRGRKPKYISIHKQIIHKTWILSNYLCAELLHPVIVDYMDALLIHGEIKTNNQKVIQTCKKISLGSLKNIIRDFHNPRKRKYKSTSPIYKRVPIDANFRRYTDEPGNIEIDYVEHRNGVNKGKYVITGTYVDLYSQWVCRAAGLGKNISSVKKIYETVISRIYHDIKRLHPDNCKSTLSFLTQKLANEKNSVIDPLSRSRPYHSNDNAHVEQKNGDKVRKLVGYWGYNTQEAVVLLNDLYLVEDMIVNFYTPCMKLVSKDIDEHGRVIRKNYSKATTPYKRLMTSKQVDEHIKKKLKSVKKGLDLVKLRNRSDKILYELSKC